MAGQVTTARTGFQKLEGLPGMRVFPRAPAPQTLPMVDCTSPEHLCSPISPPDDRCLNALVQTHLGPATAFEPILLENLYDNARPVLSRSLPQCFERNCGHRRFVAGSAGPDSAAPRARPACSQHPLPRFFRHCSALWCRRQPPREAAGAGCTAQGSRPEPHSE